MAEDATASALSDMTPQPPANPDPDAQATVNDFLDYTEFFPCDLHRSLRLIKDLDQTYLGASLDVHELSKTYGKLPNVPANERPDPIILRRDIASAVDKAIYCRESTYAEASRLYEVTQRHLRRLKIIKTKLQALPEPPSRDPTPVPVSPQASRSLHRSYDRGPRLQLYHDGARHGASMARPRDRSRKSNVPLPRGRARSYSSSDISDADSDMRSTIDLATSRIKLPKERTPKVPKSARARPAGVMGTNVHSSVAGISTSNALARLAPPPKDAKPGSRHAPWFQLTEYELAVLRKLMKKNAVWTPSETMIRRELEKKKRGQTYYEMEKERCEATGEPFLDEPLDDPSLQRSSTPAPVPVPVSVTIPSQVEITEIAKADDGTPTPVLAHTPAPAPWHTTTPTDTPATPIEPLADDSIDDPSTVAIGVETKDTRKIRESQRQQAMRDARELEEATSRIKEAGERLKELNFGPDSVDVTPTSARRRSATRPSNKRKRDTSPLPFADSPTGATREASLASQDSGTRQPDAKRIRLPNLQPIAPAPASAAQAPSVSTPRTATPVLPSPVAIAPVTLPLETTKTTTVQVPLAPAGPSTPKATVKIQSRAASRHPTPSLRSPVAKEQVAEHSVSASVRSPTAATSANVALTPIPSQHVATAASSRPRRESVAAVKAVSPSDAPAQPLKTQKTPTPAPESTRSLPIHATRPRSARGHVPTPKAQSEEPKPNDEPKPTRELRRHSIFSQSAVAAPTRMSTRKKPPPKGDITSAENGQKTVTNVKRAQGSKNKKKKKADEDHENSEDIDPDEPRYCICDDVSYGQMISCDNNCEKEWFHLECVHMTEKDIPSRRAKWYCPDCRQQLGVDAYGNPLVPPSLPGRVRGNRSV